MLKRTDDSSYYAFAEADYPFFVKMYEEGSITPGMAAMGQDMCERYLKHIIYEYAAPENRRESL